MDKEKIFEINEERLEAWKKTLAEANATPVLIIGLECTNHTFCIIATEDPTREQIKKVLEIVISTL